MSNFDAKTGSPPARRRYRVSYRARLLADSDGPWSFGDIEVISRSEAEARDLASQIGGDGFSEYQILECKDVTEGS